MNTIHLATLALVLAAISTVACVAALVVMLLVRSEVRKIRRQNISSQRMHWDSGLGICTSRPEEIQKYRDSLPAANAPPPDASPGRAAALEEWKLGQPPDRL